MRTYVLSNSIAAFTGPKTIVEIGCATNKILEILRLEVSQSTTETDDSTRLEWGTYTASGIGTNVAANVEAVDDGDAAFSGTAEDNHSTDISTGEIIKGRSGVSLLAGFEKIILPRSRLIIPGAGFFGLQLKVAINSVTLVYEIEFGETG